MAGLHPLRHLLECVGPAATLETRKTKTFSQIASASYLWMTSFDHPWTLCLAALWSFTAGLSISDGGTSQAVHCRVVVVRRLQKISGLSKNAPDRMSLQKWVGTGQCLTSLTISWLGHPVSTHVYLIIGPEWAQTCVVSCWQMIQGNSSAGCA